MGSYHITVLKGDGIGPDVVTEAMGVLECVGITMCEAAMKGASLNVFINTKLMKDRELAEDMNFKADKMLAEAAQIEEETFGRVMDAVRP